MDKLINKNSPIKNSDRGKPHFSGALWLAHASDAYGHPRHARHGHHSAYVDNAETPKWVAFDLGESRPVNTVILYPIFPLHEEGCKEQWRASGLYFPRAVRIEAADRADFSDARTVAEWSDPVSRRESDFDKDGVFLGWFHADPQDAPVRIGFAPVSARHFRLVATRLGGYYSSHRLKNNQPKRFALALAEVELLSETDDNVALSAKVTVSDQLDGVPRYAPEYLNDGRKHPLPPATLFRKAFNLAEQPVEAVLEATAFGVYAAFINGNPVSADRLAPEWAQYERRLLVQRYDVTALIRPGANAIAAAVGDGWAFGTLPMGITSERSEGFYHQLAARLTLRFADGRIETLVTDDSWLTHAESPWRQTDLFLGEVFDRRHLAPGWDRPGFDDADWRPATTRPLPGADADLRLEFQAHPGIRVAEEIPCVGIAERASGIFLLDFGVMVLGVCRIRLRGEAGRPIRLQHVQCLEPDGSPHTFNLCAAMQRDTVIPEGDAPFLYEPLFTIHSFRYVEITGASAVETSDAVALLIHSDAGPAGVFESSHSGLDAIVEGCDRAICQNLLSVSTDCAGRERTGWAVSEAGASATFFQRKAGPLFRKWLGDFADGFQKCDAGSGEGQYRIMAPVPSLPAGKPQATAAAIAAEVEGVSSLPAGKPQARIRPFFNFGWSDCPLVLCWQHWLHYGDRSVIEENWPTLRRQTLLLERIAPARLTDAPEITTALSDWLGADTLHQPIWTGSGHLPDPSRQTAFDVDRATFAYALLARDIDLSARIAALFGADTEARRWQERLAFLKTYFAHHFFEEGGKAKCHAQGAYALALSHDLLPTERIGPALGWLDHAIALAGDRFATGFHCTPLLLHALSRHRRHAAACRLVLRDKPGGYGYMMANGATSIWERWDSDAWLGKAYMNDLCHRDFTSVADWVWQHVVGIQPVEQAPGFAKVRIAPKFDGPLDHIRASHQSARGEIRVEWQRQSDGVEVEIVLPDGMSGVLEIEGERPVPLEPGPSQHSPQLKYQTAP